MSVRREIVAKVAQVPVEKCDCRHCQYAFTIINDWMRCQLWKTSLGASNFCSFFMKATPEDIEKDYMREPFEKEFQK